MKVVQKDYSKETFIEFLRKNNISDNAVEKFVLLPENLTHRNIEYKLTIISTWYNTDNPYYNFELNYYSEELIEYLFNSKVFNDIELSINNLICELQNSKIIIGDCK